MIDALDTHECTAFCEIAQKLAGPYVHYVYPSPPDMSDLDYEDAMALARVEMAEALWGIMWPEWVKANAQEAQT